ncbi:hypothetical protein PsYK624_104890 [Phanerochaete sordida]|uniref:Uncharacterized protein n=1 Tax=Phanerochaete sordida TaxID=48140 RepID=A0A9P3GIM2_9APHY|nr:hypothetical protein PsYK624_104890 [Phanerochaete sordida]
MDGLRMDVEHAPDLVVFFNSRTREMRQEMEKLKKENEGLREENHNLKVEAERASQAKLAIGGEDSEASNDAEAELIRTRHELAGSNREVQELVSANSLLEKEVAGLRSELDALRNEDQDRSDGPLSHNSERNWKKLCAQVEELRLGMLQRPSVAHEKEMEPVQLDERPPQPSAGVSTSGNPVLVEADTSGSSGAAEEPEGASAGSVVPSSQTSRLDPPSEVGSGEMDGEEARGSADREIPSAPNRVRFAIDGPGPEASIPCVTTERKWRLWSLPGHIRKLLAPCGFVFFSPTLTVFPAHGRHDCARVIDAKYRYRLTDGGERCQEASHLSKGVAGSTVDLFHEQNGGICYLGTYEYTAISQLSPAEFKELSHAVRKAIISVTLKPLSMVSAAERERAVKQYLAGELHAQYADLQFMTFNRALYNALQAWKNHIQDGPKQLPTAKRKADGDTPDTDVRKKARV